MLWWLKIQLARLWPLIWHYGISVGIAILALAFAWFSPVFKKTALWVAVGSIIITISYGVRASNGMARVQAKWDAALAASISQSERLAVTLSAMCLMTLLANCATTGTTGTATDKASRCAAWRAITYSAKGDTNLTVDQIRIHNAVGRRLGCWK